MKISIPKGFKLEKTWIILAVAIGIGLVAALSAHSFLTGQMEAFEARAKGNAVEVIVAKRNLAPGTRITSDNIAVREVPTDFAHSTAISPREFERLQGRVLANSIKAGETILWGFLAEKKAATFSARVEAGHRAMTVPVDEINSISGLLEPGDVIDLVTTIDERSGKVTFPLLQAVRVMATGQRSVDDPKSGERRSYSTVTLNTTPEQAQRVIVAREAGKITALLRNPQDTQQMSGRGVDITALLGIRGNAGRPTGSGRQIPVLYGGSAKLAPEALQLAAPTTAAASIEAASAIAATAVDRSRLLPNAELAYSLPK